MSSSWNMRRKFFICLAFLLVALVDAKRLHSQFRHGAIQDPSVSPSDSSNHGASTANGDSSDSIGETLPINDFEKSSGDVKKQGIEDHTKDQQRKEFSHGSDLAPKNANKMHSESGMD